MLSMLARNWWALALRGVFAVIFGILACVSPGATITALVLVFAAYALVDGVFAIVAALRGTGGQRRWSLLIEGLLGVIAGLVAWRWPDITALAFLFLIAAWAISTGIFEIVAAIALRRELTGEWLLALSGIGSVIFGVLLVALPSAGILTLAWLIGSYALLFGILLIVLAFRLRGMGGSTGANRQRTA